MMIRFQNVSFSYKKEEKVLHSVNLELHPGLSLLLGPNGCGKSTLLKLASGVEIPDWIENHTQSGATVVVVSHMIEPFIDLASAAVTVQSGKVFRFRDLPDLYEKKLAFLEQLAEGGLPL